MKFYFHIRRAGAFVVDREGVECENRFSARLKAEAIADGLRFACSSSELSGKQPMQLEVADDEGRFLFAVPWRSGQRFPDQ